MSRPASFPPPAFGRVLALLVGLAWRRFSNGTAVGFGAFRRKQPAAGGRQATPRKARGGTVGMLFLLAIWLFSAMNMSTQTLRQAGRVIDAPANLSVDDLSDLPRLAREQGSRGGDRVDRGPRLPWPDRSLWPAAEAEPAWLRLQAVLLLAMFLAVLITQFGMANQDLAKVESSLEWLFTFPVSARTLFAAKIGEYVALNGFLWLMVAPSLCCLFLAAGRGWLAVPLALGFALLQAVCMATVRLVAECWLRRHVSPAGIKNVQAACTILGMTLLMACFAVPSHEWLMRQAVEAGSIAGPSLVWLPSGWPAAACRQGLLAAVFAGGTCATGLVLAAGLWAAGSLTRDGLVTAGATLVGARQPAARRAMAGGIGIATKDLLLLLRDRNFLVQTLVVPLAMAGSQAAINGEATLAALASPTHGPAIAFGLGAYVLVFSALQVLGAEGQGLWLLYTVPRRLDDLLLRKAAVWGGIALVYTGAVLAAAAVWQKAISLEFVVAAAMAVVGVFLHAFIAAGIGTLATDPLATDPRRRIHPDRMFLFMLLAGFYAYAIYTPSLWAKLAQLVLSTGLAIAVWQKVRDQLPYLLDPVSAPPPRIDLADGMLAAVAFFVVQGIIAVILTLSEMPLSPGAILLIAFAGAGAVVAVTTLLAFWRRRVPDLLAEVGLRRGADGAGRGAVASLAIGLATGAAAIGGAWLYLAVVPRVPALRALALEQKAQAAVQEAAFGVGWIALLAILAAPLCEEYIFRGLVFRGLRRTSSAALACVASAALFAIVHPPLSVIPVFGLGLACGLAFESTKTLLAPIAAHALYNAVVLLVLAPAFLERLPEPPPPAPPQLLNDAARPLEAGKGELVLPGQNLASEEPCPLLVILHAAGGSPREAVDEVGSLADTWHYAIFAPCGSTRATAGGTWNREPGYDWNAARDLDRVANEVRELRAKLPIHSNGIYLVGHGSGANMAYLLGIRHPNLFTGVIAVGGRIEPELLDAAEIARAAPRLPVFTAYDMQDRALTPAIRSKTVDFLAQHSFTTRTVEYPRLPRMDDLLHAGIGMIVADHAELLKALSAESPEQAAARMRQEVPQAMAVAIAGRFVIASDVPEEARGRVLADLAAVQGRCAALVGRGDPGQGPAIRLYYPGTQRDLGALYRTIMNADIPGTHGLVTWSPTRAWASADVGSGSLAHEAVHVLVQSDWPQVPGWLNESLAVALGCPKVGMQITDRLATDDLWLHVGRQALAADRWTPVAVTFECEGSDYGSCDTVDLEIAAGATIKVGPLLTGRLLIRMLDETGRLDRFYRGWRDQGGAAGALEAIGLGDAAVLDRELRAWTAARPPDSGR
jgi:membrane protease YdiL (CAAX protease family)/predicted esterase